VELASVCLRFRFEARVDVADAQLALENPEESQVMFDGRPVAMNLTGHFTDKAIATVALPDMVAGTHTIEIQLSFTKKTSIEWVYLLGDFGVTIEGLHGVVTAPVRTLSFGDWTLQGLPFYGGNVTYHCTAPVAGDAVQLPHFKGTAVKVCSQGQVGVIYRAPYQAEVPVKAGAAVDITVFGHRANCFGPIHLAEPGLVWLGPDSYRTKGTFFSPEFQLRPLGITSAPIVYA